MDWPSVHLLVFFLSHFLKKANKNCRTKYYSYFYNCLNIFTFHKGEKKTVQKVIKVWVCQYLCTEKFCLEYKIPCILPSRQIEKLFSLKKELDTLYKYFSWRSLISLKKKNAWNCHTFLIIRYFQITPFCKWCLVRKNDQWNLPVYAPKRLLVIHQLHAQ